LAVVGLDTTTGVPPLITEVAVYHLAGGVATAGPLVWPVAVDAPMSEIPHRCRPNMRLAPPWSQVTRYLVVVLARRALVVHDESRLTVLRRHLPEWEPDRVLHSRDLAERVWPGLYSYDLGPVTAAVGIHQIPEIAPGAVAEANAVVMLLATLAAEAVRHGERAASARRDPR